MRNFQKAREALPSRTRWVLCTLAALAGVFAATVGFGLGASAQASGSKKSGSTTNRVVTTAAKTTHNTTAETMPYSGGRLMTADPTGGYWTTTWLGVVTAHGGAPTFGSPAQSGLKLAKPIVGMAATPDGQGYWLVATDGGVFSYGDAKFYGSTGAIHLNQPIVNMESTPDGLGYWLVASDGGVFTYGDAKFYGSTGAIHLNKPIVGMSATTTGRGYWLVASDGGVFTYGDAKFYGSTGAIHLNEPIAGIAPTPYGTGYWLVAEDGGIFTFGDAAFSGTLGETGTVAGIVVDPSTGDYTLVEVNGTAAVPTLTPVAATPHHPHRVGPRRPPQCAGQYRRPHQHGPRRRVQHGVVEHQTVVARLVGQWTGVQRHEHVVFQRVGRGQRPGPAAEQSPKRRPRQLQPWRRPARAHRLPDRPDPGYSPSTSSTRPRCPPRRTEGWPTGPRCGWSGSPPGPKTARST